MFIIVSSDANVPLDLKDKEYEFWSFDDFVTNASSGINSSNIDGFYVNVDYLEEYLYEALSVYIEDSENKSIVTFYRFTNSDVRLSYNITHEIKEYSVEEKVDDIEKEIDEEIKQETKEETEHQSTETVSDEAVESVQEKEVIEKTEEIKEDDTVLNDTHVEDVIEVSDIALSIKGKVDFGNLLTGEEDDEESFSKKPAKVYVFGSLKGGVGKSTTCLMTAHRFATKNPDLKVAVCDFDIYDGQVSPLLKRVYSSFLKYYRNYLSKTLGDTEEEKNYIFRKNAIKSDRFPSNVDFYLGSKTLSKEYVEDREFWYQVVERLLMIYDVVFFDTGTEYKTVPAISSVYKIADRIILLSNTSISSVNSIVRQLKELGGHLENDTFSKEEEILDKVRVVLTRSTKNREIIMSIKSQIVGYAKIVAVFGALDNLTEALHWFLEYDLIYSYKEVLKGLDNIIGED